MNAHLMSCVRVTLPLLIGGALTGCGEEPEPTPTPLAPTPEATPTDRDGDGVTAAAGDCDDRDSSTVPGGPEYPDNRDNNCDGEIDEGTTGEDIDGDGISQLDGDCEPSDPAVHPGATEVLNGVDDDCSGWADDNLTPSRQSEPVVEVPPASADALWRASDETQLFTVGVDTRWLGDIDADGHDDLSVTVFDSDYQGRVYLLYGPLGQLPEAGSYADAASAVITGVVAENLNGVIVAGGGDFNGDGVGDFAVGDPIHRRVALFYGGERLAGGLTTDQADVIFYPKTGGFYMTGMSTTFVGDTDGDGYGELAIGQPLFDNGRGRVMMFYGREGLSGLVDLEAADRIVEGITTPDATGTRIFAGGDINGDGLAEFVILSSGGGAYALDYVLSHTGLTWTGDSSELGVGHFDLYYGSQERRTGVESAASADSRVDPSEYGLAQGAQVAAGDLDGDGLTDLAFGLPTDLYGYGSVRVLYGDSERLAPQTTLDEEIHTLVLGDRNDVMLGSSVSIGDLDADGYGELVVGTAFRVGWVYESQVPEGDYCIEGWGCVDVWGAVRVEGGDVAVFWGRPTRDPLLARGESGGTWIRSTEYFDAVVGRGVTEEGQSFIGIVLPPDHSSWSDEQRMHLVRPAGATGDIDGDGRRDLIVGSSLLGRALLDEEEVNYLSNDVSLFTGEALAATK